LIAKDVDPSVEYLTEKDLQDFRKASVVHKICRKHARSMLCTGASIAQLVNDIEQLILRLTKQDPLTYFTKGSMVDNMGGIAFPVGVNVNNVIAHDSKMMGHDDRTFNIGDLVKIDIGVHMNGRIIDSAFSHIITDKAGVHDVNNIYNPVLDASRESVYSAIAMSGPDQHLLDISEFIAEIIGSYEVDVGNDPLPIRPVKGIGGHSIKRYQIHGGKLLLSEPDQEIQEGQKMLEGEVYAIETYASTGGGVMTQNEMMNNVTHMMCLRPDEVDKLCNIAGGVSKKDIKHFRKTEIYNWCQTRNGLPYSMEWVEKMNIPKLQKGLKMGVESKQMHCYPPLYDVNGSVVAQFEHTIHIKDGGVEIFSLGDDY